MKSHNIPVILIALTALLAGCDAGDPGPAPIPVVGVWEGTVHAGDELVGSARVAVSGATPEVLMFSVATWRPEDGAWSSTAWPPRSRAVARVIHPTGDAERPRHPHHPNLSPAAGAATYRGLLQDELRTTGWCTVLPEKVYRTPGIGPRRCTVLPGEGVPYSRG